MRPTASAAREGGPSGTAATTSGWKRSPNPAIERPGDAIVRITSTGLCGSDLHLYTVMAPFMTPGDVLGHEPMGVVEAIGSECHRPVDR